MHPPPPPPHMQLRGWGVHLPGMHLMSNIVEQRATDGVGRVLEAVGAASGIIRALQQHYVTIIEPRVEESPTEATACATGLAALVRAVERQVLNALQAALSAFFAQVSHAP